MTVDELANVAGNLEFRKLENTGNIVDLLESDKDNKKGCFAIKQNSGDTWASAMALGKNTNIPIDVVHLEFGRDIPHNTLPPSKAVYIWLRIA